MTPRAPPPSPVALRLAAALLIAGAVLAAPPAPAPAAAKHPQRRVILLGLRQRGRVARFARRVSNPASARYRRFVGLPEFRRRFSAPRADRRRVVRFLHGRRGVRKVELSSTPTGVLVVMTP